jgi:hypothetical protein
MLHFLCYYTNKGVYLDSEVAAVDNTMNGDLVNSKMTVLSF